jgi:hypothetical protein
MVETLAQVNHNFFSFPHPQSTLNGWSGRAHPGESKYALRVIGGAWAWGAELRTSASREITTRSSCSILMYHIVTYGTDDHVYDTVLMMILGIQ